MHGDRPSQKPLRAVFLAAGFGTRLYPLTRNRAKPLLEIGGQPMLTRLLRQVERTARVRDVTVVINEKFRVDFERWRAGLASALPVTLVSNGVVDDRANRGAVADLALALSEAPESDGAVEGYLVAAGDNLFDFELGARVEQFLQRREPQLFLRTIPEPVPPGRYSEVEIDPDGRVRSFREKPDDPRSNLSAIAVYVLPAELPQLVQTYLSEGQHPDAPGYLLAWLAKRGPVRALPFEGAWFDVGNAKDLAKAQAEWSERDA